MTEWEPSQYYKTINGERREILPRTKCTRPRESTGQSAEPRPTFIPKFSGTNPQSIDDM